MIKLYTVTNGSSEQQFFYLTDANNFLNSNSSWYLVDQSEPRWEYSRNLTKTFSNIDSLTVKHDSGSGASAIVFDENGDQFECSSEEIDKNTIKVEWIGNKSGKAVITAGFS